MVSVSVGKKGSGPVVAMTEDANRVEYEKDKRGRTIGVRKYNFLNTHRITCLMGDAAGNEAAMNQAVLAACVAEIDGDAVRFPMTLGELHAIMARLDLDGIAAAGRAMARFFPAEDGEEERQAIKNS